MRSLILILITGLLVGCTFGEQPSKKDITTSFSDTNLPGIHLLEEVEAESGKIVIPYKKYQLKNGLILILHEDHSDPLVHVDVTYHVGSAREEPGKSGFAHFFEHMMFQGSENVDDEQHMKLVTDSGGTFNGGTSEDTTSYFQTVPANQIEKILWLEADRMGFLVDAVTQEKFEIQRDTVKNERGQRIDNQSYGRLSERVSEALYPEGHPYSWPVIGYLEDLNRADVNDLKRFFLKWYGPNNATVTIGGDIDIKQTLQYVVKYFGSIPTGPEIKMPEKPLIKLKADRYISMQDNVQLPLVYMSLPTVIARHEDEAPLDLLTQILGGGKTSLFYKNLVKNQFAVQASVSHPCGELGCTFNMFALPNPESGKSLAALEKIMRDTLIEFEKRGVVPDDLAKAKAQMEARFIFGLQSVDGKVGQLAANQTFTGNPNYIEKDITRYLNVTKQDVERVFKQYIKDNYAVVMSIVPIGETGIVTAEDNFEPEARMLVAESKISKDELVLRKVKDNFDRSVIPNAGNNPPAEVPQMWQQKLANGIRILGSQSTETPTTSLLIKIPAGHYYERKNKAGTSTLLASMLNESTTEKSAEEMSLALQLLGSHVSVSSSNLTINVNINSLTKNIDETMKLVNEKLFNPAFLQTDFDRNKNHTLQGIAHSKKDASYLASTAYRRLLNGDNIIGIPAGGSEQSVTSISLEDVKAFYETYFKPKGAQLIIVSDKTEKQLMSILSDLEVWKGQGLKLDLNFVKPNAKAGVVYLVNKEQATQSVIRIGKRGIKQDITGEYYRAFLMNFPLGGAFNSRINLNLREDKGYTYGARTYFWGNKLIGGFTATAEVRADVTDKSIVELVNEIKGYQENGISEAEISFMRNAINQRDALKYETPGAKLGFLAKILEHNLTSNFVAERAEIVNKITHKEINALAKKHLNIDEMLIVVVGDTKTLRPQLEALGYEVIGYSI